MQLCDPEGCTPICDFCKDYSFNGNKLGVYIDEGFCKKHQVKKDPEDNCDDFVCRNVR